MTQVPASSPIDTLAEVRRVRHEISAKFGHDPKRLVEHYMELQKESPERLVNYGDKSKLKLPAPLILPLDSSAPIQSLPAET
jgi:hypothetical protein